MKVIKYWINDIYYGEQILENNNSTTVFQKCSDHNIHLPCFCYHESLSIAGNCRMCLVEINTSLKLVVSCSMPLTDGVKIYTSTNRVRKAREAVIEFLLINHPLDCPICDQGGECDLQDITLAHGSNRSTYYEYTKCLKSLAYILIIIRLILKLLTIYCRFLILLGLHLSQWLRLYTKFRLLSVASLAKYLYNYQMNSNYYSQPSILFFNSSYSPSMIVRKVNSTINIRTVRQRIKKHVHTQTKLDEEQVVPIYIEEVHKSLKQNPRFKKVSEHWQYSKNSQPLEDFEQIKHRMINKVLQQDIKDIKHPGVKNAVCFEDPIDGNKKMVLYGSNITHSKSVKGVPNVNYAYNHDGSIASLTTYAKTSLPIEVKKFEAGGLVDKRYLTDPTRFPIDSENKAHQAISEGKVKLLVDTNNGQLIEITGEHKEAYMNPPNPDTASVDFAGSKINALYVTSDDPIAKASLTAYDDRAEKVLSNLEETLNKFRD